MNSAFIATLAVTPLVFQALPALSVQNDQTQVKLPSGMAHGTAEGGVIAFKGTPCAVAPVGNPRWRPPQPLPARQGKLEADAFGPSCMQPAVDRLLGFANDGMAVGPDPLKARLDLWADAWNRLK